MVQTVRLLASGDWGVTEEWEFLAIRYARGRIDFSHHEALVYLSWLHTVTFLLRLWLIFDPEGIESYVHQVVATLLGTERGRATA